MKNAQGICTDHKVDIVVGIDVEISVVYSAPEDCAILPDTNHAIPIFDDLRKCSIRDRVRPKDESFEQAPVQRRCSQTATRVTNAVTSAPACGI